MNAAGRWAEFVCGLRFDDLPAGVIHRMKRSLLDALGAMTAGARIPSCRILLDHFAAQGARPEATILPGGLQTTAANAAMLNGSFVHSSELWEVHIRARIQSGCIIPPAALAVAEKQGSSGKELLTAMVAGHEVAVRVGLATRVDPDSATYAVKRRADPATPYFLSGSTYGLYGVAATAGRLLGLDQEQMKHALTIGSSVTPVIGLEQSGHPAGMPKELYQGFAAGAGVTASELAARGFTGRDDVDTHLGALDPDHSAELLTRGLGTDWLVESGMFFKRHSGGGMVLPAAAALLELGPVKPTDVEGIDVYVSHLGAVACAEVDPPNTVAARSSIPYLLSALLMFADELDTDPHLTGFYTGAKLRHPARAALARRIRVLPSDDFEQGFEAEWPLRFPASVVVHDRAGATRSATTDIAAQEWTEEEVTSKFRNLAGWVLAPCDLDLVIEEVFALDRRPDVLGIVRAMTGGR